MDSEWPRGGSRMVSTILSYYYRRCGMVARLFRLQWKFKTREEKEAGLSKAATYGIVSITG